MRGLSASHLVFEVQVQSAVVLEGQPGSAIRGALYGVLADNFCTAPDGPHTRFHAENCPVCWLLALEDADNARGRNLPRPITIQPPEPRMYRTGEVFRFGVTLIGNAQGLFPYVARAVERAGRVGIGRGRGEYRLKAIYEYSPLLDVSRQLNDQTTMRRPTLQVTQARVLEATEGEHDRILIDLRSPTRLISDEKLVRSPDAKIFMARLLERCQQLATVYGDHAGTVEADEWRTLHQDMMKQAAEWKTTFDETQWFEAFSGSRRTNTVTPISGLMGRFRWEGDLTDACPWLMWGQSIHVGKSAVKGNGWYSVVQ